MKQQDPITIDCQYLYPKFAASYLLIEDKKREALFIDNNTSHSTPLLLNELQNQGLHPEQIRYLIITHLHLDHAGGTESLLKYCPNAVVLAHPRAAPHLIDPTKLIGSAKKVYGEDVFRKLYGEIHPIHSSRIRTMNDGEELTMGNRTLRFFYTRGHANHHFCIFDSGSQAVFTGDSFGLAYPLFQSHGLFIFPSTSPTDFDPAEARISIRKILETKAQQAFLTHFGGITDLKNAASQLYEHLDLSERILEEALKRNDPSNLLSSLSSIPSPNSPPSDRTKERTNEEPRVEPKVDTDELTRFCRAKLQVSFEALLEKRGMHLDQKQWEILGLDLDLNASGIAYAAWKKRG